MPDEIEIKKLKKEIKVLEKKLKRSETNRATLEEIRDRNSNMFQVLNKELEEAKKIYQNALKVISSSIEYASYIQKAILPDNETISSYFSDSFLIWEPRDVVGGDIYFFEELALVDGCLFMIIDCTGHGVPGALVTALVKAVEQQIVAEINSREQAEISPAKILGFFNRKIKQLLKQENEHSISNAGFDGGVLYHNKKENIIRYAGAETPLFFIQNQELKVIKGDRHSIGYKKSNANYEFSEHTINVDKETFLYLTTDGFLDQNGGNKGFPFGKKQFKQLLLEHYQLDFTSQKEAYIKAIRNYQGSEDKNDDMTFVGIKIG